jgi:hypothetical protein
LTDFAESNFVVCFNTVQESGPRLPGLPTSTIIPRGMIVAELDFLTYTKTLGNAIGVGYLDVALS